MMLKWFWYFGFCLRNHFRWCALSPLHGENRNCTLRQSFYDAQVVLVLWLLSAQLLSLVRSFAVSRRNSPTPLSAKAFIMLNWFWYFGFCLRNYFRWCALSPFHGDHLSCLLFQNIGNSLACKAVTVRIACLAHLFVCLFIFKQ